MWLSTRQPCCGRGSAVRDPPDSYCVSGTARHRSSHPLSRRDWKTAEPLVLEATCPKGTYYICTASSSRLKDKGVDLDLTVTMTPK